MGAYVRPATVADALDVLAAGVQEGRPRVIVAGATDHYPVRVGRVVDEDVLDVSGIAGLQAIQRVAGGWLVPALATWTDLAETELPPWFDGLRRAAVGVGGRQIQNRATVVGNVCNASAAADGLPNLIALDAVVQLASARGTRTVAVEEFVTGNGATMRAPDELVTGLVVPDPEIGSRAAAGSAFLKLGSRAYLVIAIAMVAAVVVRDAGGRITSARVAVGACSAVARRLRALEAELIGRPAGPGVGAFVRPGHLESLTPIDDVRGTAAYRRAAALVLVRRVLEEVVA